MKFEAECRQHFPALETGYIFADNAGGSQCLKGVADRIYDYLLNTNVQIGADYSVSAVATKRTLVEPQEVTARLINAASPEEISFGSSSTMLAENLARGIEPDVRPDEEFVVSFADHEANIGPWVKLAKRTGAKLVSWEAKPTSESSDNPFCVALLTSDLEHLITSKTRIVSFTACSNILGAFTDPKAVIAAIRKIAESKGTRKLEVCVDCVAFAPHRRIDVRDWDVDYVFFSYYKVYGPHTSVLYSREASLNNSVTSLAHFFLNTIKLQPGGPGYELTYGTTGVLPYLLSLGEAGGPSESARLDLAFQRIAEQEEVLMKPLIGFLLSKRNVGVRIVGPESWAKEDRAPTISFTVVGQDGKTKRLQSRDVVAKFDAVGDIGIRYGHFYSYRLIQSLGMDPADGIIRISLVHYNTVAEVHRLIAILETIL